MTRLHAARSASLFAVLAAASAHASTTVVIVGGPTMNTYAPGLPAINVGDTVLWDWNGGLHSVHSGVIITGVPTPDSNFSSGPATSNLNTTFSVTFDQGFLSSHPMPNNEYPYYCDVHGAVFGMTGKIKVNFPPSVASYGCTNPPGSLTQVSGAPKINTSFKVGVHNPLGTQGAGSLAFVSASFGPNPLFPCGLGIPGFGMAGPGAPGEILVDTTPGVLLLPLLGPSVWTGTPATVNVNLPNSSVLLGLHLYLEGVLFDPVAAGGVAIGLAEAFDCTIGN